MLKKRPRTPPAATEGNMEIDTLIGPKAEFKGELAFSGVLRIDGRFEGTITAHEDATLIVSETAKIKGEVHVPNLRLHGTIEGNVRAANSVLVGAKGVLIGDLEYRTLAIEEGASINGRCTRIQPEPAKKPQAKPAAKPEPSAA
ncbi:MAG: polymer-forming cytoskeletal protein [Zetaproteobacteria bacterium]|nr:MAG: polymer-forming cytoskeletal protein [Zetaproteobacteria bacterium]